MRLIKLIVMVFTINALILEEINAQPSRVDVDVSVQFSFSELNEYGEWVIVPGYGRVWKPYADVSWRPFMYGRWVWTSDGWLWESYEPFGWIVFHYGNWYYDDEWGWVWVPGYEWSPARVEWYITDNEIAWRPLLPPSPPGRRVHTYIEWSFCPVDFFVGVEVHRYVRFRPLNTTVVVRHGPPQIDFIRKRAKVEIVSYTPRKVTVRANNRAFVKVEYNYTPHREKIVIPIGPKFRGHRPKVRVEREPEVVVEKREEPSVKAKIEIGIPKKIKVESRVEDDENESRVRVRKRK